MVLIKVKHMNRGLARDFALAGYDTTKRAVFIKENKEGFTKVAELTYNYCTEDKAMNNAWRDTNSVDAYWPEVLSEDAKLFPFENLIGVEGYRSSMVGDIFEVNGVDYFVDSYGFSKVEA